MSDTSISPEDTPGEPVFMPLRWNGHTFPDRAFSVGVIPLGNGKTWIDGPHGCFVCDERPELVVGNKEVEVSNPCPYPDGITTKITLNVPSGKLIVSDDLRPTYDWDGEFASYNSTLGQAQVVRAMAAIGCAFGPVGNSCPGLYRTGPDSYIIASPGSDEDDNPLLPEDACLADICTDLWAYSIADFDDWKARGGDPEMLRWKGTVVEVPPGRYQFTHHSGERGFDAYAWGTVIFAHIQRIN